MTICGRRIFLAVCWCLCILIVLQILSIVNIPYKKLTETAESQFAQESPYQTKLQHLDVIPNTSNVDLVKKSIHNEINIDKSVLLESMLIDDVQRKFPSLPIEYWNRHKNTPMFYKNKTCAKFPSIFDLQYNNMYWQTFETTNGTFQLYGAYYDERRFNKLAPTIRILGIMNRIEPTIKTYCQIWFEDSQEPVFAQVVEYKYIWNKAWGNYVQGIYQPYLVSCQVPPNYHTVPASVSLVQKPCDTASNNLKVIFNKPEEKKDFAVCVKGLDILHVDLSVRLVEWIELLGILGADKIFFYELAVHPNVSKVLRHYERLDRVAVTPITLPGDQPNLSGLQHLYLLSKLYHKRQNEVIPYNDCFYKNVNTYKYIVLLDIDEVIMPTNTNSWKELMNVVDMNALGQNEKTNSTYCVRNVYFLDDMLHAHGCFEDIPKYMHMLQHVYRAKTFSERGKYAKCFHNTEKVLTLHNHFPFACIGNVCTRGYISPSNAQLQHYRSDCVRDLSNEECSQYRKYSITDTTIWKFKDSLTRNTTNTLEILGFIQV